MEGFGGLRSRRIAQKIAHQRDYPGHAIRFSSETELFECDSCEYTFVNKYTEKEVERMVAAEFEDTAHSRYYEREIGAIWEANFHHVL